MNSTRSWWLAIIDFFRRDLGSFFPTRSRETWTEEVSTASCLETSPEASGSPLPVDVHSSELDNLPLVLDPKKLEMIQHRRQILDWRDDAILKLSATGTEVIDAFFLDVRDRLADEPWWRRAWTRPANEVLKPDFDRRVRGTIHREAKWQEKELEKLIEALKVQREKSWRLDAEWLDSQLRCVAMYGFKPSHQTEILDGLKALVVGPQGIVEGLHKHALGIAVELTEKACRS